MTAYTGPERRVVDPLDPLHPATPRQMNDTWIVTAGLSTAICANKTEAWDVAEVHNEIHIFHTRSDRRAS